MSKGERPTVVAVPARDEADRIGACLRALCSQRSLDGAAIDPAAFGVVVLANNCTDATAQAAAAVDPRVRVVAVDLPPGQATAGGARRAAMEAAAALLPSTGGVICTTDADSRPRGDWLAHLWRAFDGGAEAVAGAIDLDPHDDEPPPAFSAARRLEARYSALQAELSARLDPEPHNPWPNHLWAWGANLAVTSDAYHRVGGLPPAPLAEDRAFVDRLRRHGVPVRHCLDARVWTSARRAGRAAGGLADLVADHAGADLAPCDAALEPALTAARRALWRARLRTQPAQTPDAGRWTRRLRIAAPALAEAMAEPGFGRAWARLEAQSPVLARRRLQPGDLPTEIARAERLLARITPGAADPCDTARAASAGVWSAPAPP